jgi:hypothetical protein
MSLNDPDFIIYINSEGSSIKVIEIYILLKIKNDLRSIKTISLFLNSLLSVFKYNFLSKFEFHLYIIKINYK